MASSERADVIVIGDGLVGACCAHALAARSLSVALVGTRVAGMSTPAAGGFLAPTIEPAPGSIFTFALASRERYRSFVDELAAGAGHRVALDFDGILRVPTDEADAARLGRERSEHARWLTCAELAELEPALHAPLGALHHHDDGIVDNEALLAALDVALHARRVRRAHLRVSSIAVDHQRADVLLEDGTRLSAGRAVLAAGAWSPSLPGLPRPIPIEPVRGQILVIEGAPLRHPTYAAGGYLASRPHLGHTLVGSTYERVGYVVGTRDEDLDRFEGIAQAMIRGHPIVRQRSWSGLRPISPDFHPILGPDPDAGALLYACGHSRNGILMAPLTGDVTADLVVIGHSEFDISPFSIERFANGNGENRNP